MVIGRDAGFADKQTAAPDELLSFAVRPNVKVLVRFIPRQSHIHIFNYTAALGRGEQQSSQEYFRQWCVVTRTWSVRPKENHRGLRHLDRAATEKSEPRRRGRNSQRKSGKCESDGIGHCQPMHAFYHDSRVSAERSPVCLDQLQHAPTRRFALSPPSPLERLFHRAV